jgi:hypothetical protein
MVLAFLLASLFLSPEAPEALEALPAGVVDLIPIQRHSRCGPNHTDGCELCEMLDQQPLYEVWKHGKLIGWIEPLSSDWYAVEEYKTRAYIIQYKKDHPEVAVGARKNLKTLQEARKKGARWRGRTVNVYRTQNPPLLKVWIYEGEPHAIILKLLKNEH